MGKNDWDNTAPVHSDRSPSYQRGGLPGHLGTIPLVEVETVSEFHMGERFMMEGRQTLKPWGKFQVELTGKASKKIGSPVVMVQIQDVGGGERRYIGLETLRKLPKVVADPFAVGQTVNLEYKRSGVIRWVDGDRRAILAETSPGVMLLTYRTVEQLVALNPAAEGLEPDALLKTPKEYPLAQRPCMAIIPWVPQ